MSELFVESEVRKALSLLVAPGSVFEIRALDTQLRGHYRKSIVSGYFDNANACIAELKKLTTAKGIYFTLNPVNRALLARCANRLDYAEKYATTNDQHIVQRRRLLIDVDYGRPAGISATAAEKAAAAKKTTEIYRFLKERGFPKPVVGDSGNGHHLLYRVELPSDDGKLLERVLCALADHFDGGGVKIDRSVFNPARIARLYGTLACKGDNTKERPHRFSKILKAPESLEVVSAQKLRALVDELQPAEPPKVERPAARKGSFDVEGFLGRHGIEVAERTTEPDGTIKWRLKRCPFDPDHESPDAAVFQQPDGVLGFHCFHTSCVDKHWKDFRRHFEPEYGSSSVPKAEVPSTGAGDDDSSELTSLTSLGDAEYPAPPDEAAYYGLAGDIVRRIAPQTEADRVALLFQLLAAFGNVIGRNAYMLADGARHYLKLFIVLVGKTSKGRKGTAWRHVFNLMRHVDEEWCKNIGHGLSSGEGLIWAVRDRIEGKKFIKERGKPPEYKTVVIDDGVSDKRLLVIESEFASVLKQGTREGNILSAVIRSAWEDDNLRIMTKNTPARATDAHISIIGHITREEYRRELTQTESANGFANRYCIVAVDRSKCLPEGGQAVGIADLVVRLRKAIEFAKNRGELNRDDAARKLWAQVYPALSEGKRGLLGAITGRAEAQVLRFSGLYALLDCSDVVKVEHLKAALALWGYSERSAAWVFETGTGDRNADKILAALRVAGEKGLPKWKITANVFSRNATKHDIDEALRLLHHLKLATCKVEETGGRSLERWFYKAKGHEKNEESSQTDRPTADISFTSYGQSSENASSTESDTEPGTQAEEKMRL